MIQLFHRVLVGHDFRDAQQNKQSEKQQVDIRFQFAGLTQAPNLGYHLPALRGCGRSLSDECRQAPCFPLKPFDALEKVK
jgi:hypothetical protein